MKYSDQVLLLVVVLLVVTNSIAELTGIVSYPKNPGHTVLVSVRCDDNNKLTTINKIFSNNQELDTKIYNFNTKKYALGTLIDFQYKCRWYDSILIDYFSTNDIIIPTVYNISMSRTLSLFFSGSWAGENVTRIDNIIQSKYWQLQLLSDNNVNSNLYYLVNTCVY